MAATYRVKPGHVLPHNGDVLTEGTIVELAPHVAADVEVHYRIEPVADLPPAVQVHTHAEGPAAPEQKTEE